MRGSTPLTRPKRQKTSEKQPKHTQNHLYIFIFLWTRTGELETQPRRVETQPARLFMMFPSTCPATLFIPIFASRRFIFMFATECITACKNGNECPPGAAGFKDFGTPVLAVSTARLLGQDPVLFAGQRIHA